MDLPLKIAVQEGVNSCLAMFGKPPDDKLGEKVHAILFMICVIGILVGVGWLCVQVYFSFFPKPQNPTSQANISSSMVSSTASSAVITSSTTGSVNSPNSPTINVRGNNNATAIGSNAQATINQPAIYTWVNSSTWTSVQQNDGSYLTLIDLAASSPIIPPYECFNIESENVPISSAMPLNYGFGMISTQSTSTGTNPITYLYKSCFGQLQQTEVVKVSSPQQLEFFEVEFLDNP